MKLNLRISFALVATLTVGLACAQAQVAPTSTTPPATPTAAPTVATTTTTGALKLDAVPELKAARTKLEAAYTTVKSSGKGKAEFREGVIVLAAGDAARAKNDKPAYLKLATEAGTRFDVAKTLSTGGTGTTAGLTALKADAVVGKFIGPAETAIPAVDTLLASPTSWTLKGFEPVSF